jgi:oligopeptide transport system permease protein
MIRYIARRLVYMIAALFIIVSVTFFISKALPGDPFSNPKLSPRVREQLYEKYGLDER